MRALVIGVALLALLACKPGEPLPKIAPVPAFEMRDQDAKPFTDRELRGQTAILNFMFTSCPDICPILTTKIAGLRTNLLDQRAQLRFVSISVDPEKDSPAELKAFARQHGADYPDWRFATGPIAELRRVVVEGFKQALERGDGSPNGIMHGTHLVLIDKAGVIRGFYRSDEEGLLLIARDARRLIAGKD